MTQYALMRLSAGSYCVAEVIRDGKRFTWLRYDRLGEVRETKSKTGWRFPTREAAEAEIKRMESKP